MVVLILASSCGHKAQTKLPSASPEHELLYRGGLEAFRQATPEGYRQAIDAFRKASTLAPSRCEYSLHLAESLILLAQEQRYNWEEFEPRVSEAVGIIDSIQRAAECATFEPFVDRLRALSGPGRDALGMINRAIELDPSDTMNWYVLWRLNLGNSQEAILRAVELAPDLRSNALWNSVRASGISGSTQIQVELLRRRVCIGNGFLSRRQCRSGSHTVR